MAKKKEPIKPLYPLKHEFAESLDRFLHEAGMLRDTMRQLIQLKVVKEPSMVQIMQERLDAFDQARFGERDGD